MTQGPCASVPHADPSAFTITESQSFGKWLISMLRQHQFTTLLLFTLFALAMSGGRWYRTESTWLRFLIWNLFLAWLPFWFGLAVTWCIRQRRTWGAWLFGLLWFLFFPNAPYILTDLMHIRASRWSLWFDTLLLTVYALHGLFLGLVSLDMMHRQLRRLLGNTWSWMAIGTMVGLSGFAIYLGRFLRINSWNVFTHPGNLLQLLYDHVWIHGKGRRMLEVTLVCLTIQLLAYLLFVGRDNQRPIEH